MCPGEETVAAYVAGRLARDERDHFDHHLDTCSACHELLAALGKVATPTELGRGSTGYDDDAGATSWAPGDQLGRYVLLAQLGEGGMGVVYTAYDPELDRKVALKLVRHAGEPARVRLREEARAIAKLAHPNVVAVHDVGDAGGDVFVAMEYVDGVTLGTWLHTRRDVRAILDVFVQAGRGLAAAHAVGLVHRDVKPSNIIVGKDGRARVLDFGLARARAGDDGVVGTPAYMAPEQQRGERVDARADQYAFCVALWEALSGKRPEMGSDPFSGQLGKMGSDPFSGQLGRALRRGLAAKPEDRFASIDALLRELAPAPPSRWLLGAGAIAVIATTIAIVLLARGDDAPESCARAGDPIARAWSDREREAVGDAFAATRLPYARTAASALVGELDAWTARWQRSAEASCRATAVDRVQPAEVYGLRQACLDQLRERLVAITRRATAADPITVANAGNLAGTLPAPERCDDVTALSAIQPPPEAQRDAVATLRTSLIEIETAMIAGALDRARPDIEALAKRADALGYLPLRARAQLLVARLESATGNHARAIAALHAGAHAATAAHDLAQLAELWIELALVLGNDVALLDQADVFDGYAAALAGQLADRDELALRLDFARCNRNVSHKTRDAATIAKHCRSAIDRAGRTTPPRAAVANAARTRLGHFQRLLGDPDAARATLTEAVAAATRIHGPDHPDTAVARNALGLALLSEDKVEAALVELRAALAIRRAAYPGGNIYVVESLQTLADAVSVAGNNAEALALLGEALAMLDALGKSESLLAVNAHVLSGMALEATRPADATTHYLRAADLADQTIPDREALAILALTLAAEVAVRERKTPTAIEHLERALRLHERAKSDPGKTRKRLAELRVR